MSSAGDNNGLCSRDEVADQYYPLVASLAERYAPNEDWKLELISEGVCALLQAHDRFDPERGVHFAAFARFRVRGSMLDMLRDERRHSDRRVELERELTRGGESEDEERRLEALRSAMQRLESRDRYLLEQIFLEGRTQKDLADELELSPPRIHQLYTRALQRVREILRDSHDGSPGRLSLAPST